MTLFFFNYYTPDGCTLDHVGCDFDTFECAYIDAFRSMVAIGAELLVQQEDPASHRIEIADQAGSVLTDLRFDEVFRRRRAVHWTQAQHDALRATLDHNRRLQTELRAACEKARGTVSVARETLRRATQA